MKILITGICGFVGSTLAKSLAAEPWVSSVVGIDNLSRRGSERNRKPLEQLGIRVLHGDVRCSSDVDALPKADWVIDAAANPNVLAGIDGQTSSRQLLEHNLAGTINLLEYCKAHGTGFCLLSTSRVYSIPGLASLQMRVVNDAFAPDPEQDFPSGISVAGVNESYSTAPPVSLYGSTKVTSEHLALEYGETFGFPVWINRCGVMAGAGQFGHPAQGIFAYWIHSFRERKPLKYIGFRGQGHQVRDCLHPRDLVALLQKQFSSSANPAVEKGSVSRIVNVSGGVTNSMSLAQLTRWCNRRFGDQSVSSVTENRSFDIAWMVLDAKNAQQIWDWTPRTRLPEILDEIADFAELHEGWIDASKC
ncbi:MAG TPA: CDP-tyvelose epimerase [Planctomycetaceae bacterium]|nr:CDP-tyvelose epimerase [Planctomycetaceae bacterium]